MKRQTMLKRFLTTAKQQQQRSKLFTDPKAFAMASLFAGAMGFTTVIVANKLLGEETENKDTQQSKEDFTSWYIPQGKVTKKVFLDISIDKKPSQRLILGLYGEDCPNTVNNFSSLCVGDKGKSMSQPSKDLHFLGSKIHRILPGSLIQGGDFTNGDGTGGESIFNGQKFDDESSFRWKHNGPGVVSMANSGKNKNSSQFFITSCPLPLSLPLSSSSSVQQPTVSTVTHPPSLFPWFSSKSSSSSSSSSVASTSELVSPSVSPLAKLDGKHVVFGQVLSGAEVVREIEQWEKEKEKERGRKHNSKKDDKDNSKKGVVIVGCGLLE